MIRRIALATAALASVGLVSPAAFAQTSCASVSVVETSTGTQRVPRMGPGSDLLTQTATLQNTTAAEIRFTITLVHRAFQQNFVSGQTYTLGPQARSQIMLGNVLKPGLDLASVRAGIRVNCL